MIDMTGKEIGRYQFRERLGAGGMAMVYKAYDTRLEREVAIKIIQTDVFAPNVLAEVLQRFEREAKALARLNHPHIVKVYDFGDFDGLPYLVMEYHSGGTVKRFTNQPHPFYEVARLLAPVARALEYAHQRGILHRDVKPSNILLNENHQPLLTDFGIAKILEMSASTGLTASGVGIGTPEYIAPEQGVGSGADPRSDVYSLGIVFYELITGRRPYSADTPMGVILAHVTKPLPNPRDYVPDLPDEVISVLYQTLAKDPADRFASMGAFAEALEQLAAERPTHPNLNTAAAAAAGDAINMTPTGAHIPTPHPSTMQPVHTPAPPDAGQAVSSSPGAGTPDVGQAGSLPKAQADSMRYKNVPAAAPDVGQTVSLSPGTGTPDVGQAVSLSPGAQADSMRYKEAQNDNAVQPTLQTPVPTQYTAQPGQAEGLSRRQLRQQQAKEHAAVSPNVGQAVSLPKAPDAGQAVSLSKAQADSLRTKGRQTRPKNSSTNWIILGVLAVLAVAAIAVAVGMVLRDGGLQASPTQPVQAGGAPLASATAAALAAESNPEPATQAPVATITPLPSPTPLPQFISDQFDHALALIPAGEFLMGSLNEDTTAKDDERPQHLLNMASFYLDVHETTNFDYAKCVAESVCQPPANFGSSTAASYYDNPEFANYPVIFVTWAAAEEYCEWRGGRLPTEAEWEYAARGGLANLPYPWGDQPPTCESQAANGANSSQCPYSGPVPVGGFSNNGFGLYDMAGNVAEWTSSLMRPYPYNPADGREDPIPVEPRVLRGGSWDAETSSLRSAARRALNQNAVDNSIGFRCIVDLETVTQGSAGTSGGQPDGGSAPTGGDQPGEAAPTPTRIFRIVTPVVRITLVAPTLKIIPILPTATPTPTIGLIILPTKIIILPSPTPTIGLIKPPTPTPTKFYKPPTPTPTLFIKPPPPTDTPVPPTNTPVPTLPPPPPPRQYPPEILSPSDGEQFKPDTVIQFCFYSGYNIGTYSYVASIDGNRGKETPIGDDQKECGSSTLPSGTHTFEVTVYYKGGTWSGGVKFEVLR